MKFELDGNVFITSSFSARGDRCVAVSIQDDAVLVTNSKNRVSVVAFTHDEWAAFIAGVKQGEFQVGEK